MVDVTLVSLFATRGFLMTPIPTVCLGIVLGISLVYLVVADIVKVLVAHGGEVC